MTQKQIKARCESIRKKTDQLGKAQAGLKAELVYLQTYLCKHPVKMPAAENGIFTAPKVCADCGKQRKMTKEELDRV